MALVLLLMAISKYLLFNYFLKMKGLVDNERKVECLSKTNDIFG
jgi:hypothetical protein